MSRRVVAAAMIAYLATLVAIVFWPSADVSSASVLWMHARLQGLGFPGWVSTSAVEFVSNILLFVPLGLLASLLWRSWNWVAWTLVGFAGSLTIETAQMVLLPGRTPTLPDIVANTLGALLGALVAVVLVRNIRALARVVPERT